MANTLNFGAGKWAAKAGSVLAYNSENNNFKPLPFTFTRASTATRVNESGLIESVGSGIPRIDFLDNADGHLLLEPSRTNLLTNSEDATSVNWSQGRVTATANQSESPDGNNNADLIIDTPTTVGTHRMFTPTISAVSGTVYTFSIYIKKGTSYRGEINLINLVESSISSGSGTFDLDTLTSSGGCAIDSTLVNGYYRVTYTTTCNTTTTGRIALYQYSSSGLRSYTGDGTSTWYIWGAQLEAASYATSYIPTSGSSVTRAADAATQLTPSGVLNNAKGTIFLSFRRPTGSLDFSAFGVSDGTTSNEAFFRLTTEDTVEYYVRSGGAQTTSFSYSSIDLNVPVKIAVVYDTNYAAMYVNGILVGSDLSVTVPATINRIHFTRGNGTLNFVGEVFAAQYYNEVLSPSQLIALTS